MDPDVVEGIGTVSFVDEHEAEDQWPALKPSHTGDSNPNISSLSVDSVVRSSASPTSASPWTKRLFATPSNQESSAKPIRLPSVNKPALLETVQKSSSAASISSSPSLSAEPSVTSTSAPTSTSASTASSSFSISSSSSSASVTVLILDSGAFISGSNLSSFGPSCSYVTIPHVVSELKDAAARHRFATFPYPIIQRQPSAEAVHVINVFTRSSGDQLSLSTTDLLLLSLCWQLERETNGMKFLRSEPVRLDTALVQSFIQRQNRSMLSSTASATSSTTSTVDREKNREENREENREASAQPINQPINEEHLAASERYDEWDSEDEDEDEDEEGDEDDSIRAQPALFTNEQKEEQKVDEADPPSATAETATIHTEEDDGEGQWITSSNLHKHQDFTQQQTSPPHREESRVACMTTDYAMQNVLLQLGIRLLSVNGLSIRGIRHWLRKCHSCSAFSRDLDREFCDSCGNHTMIRVTAVLDRDPLDDSLHLRVFHGNRHLNLRGTRFSIPRPRGGRQGQPLKLSEDVMKNFAHAATKQRGNKEEGLFDSAVEFGLMTTGRPQKQDVYAYGKRNPNVVAKKTGNRRRRR